MFHYYLGSLATCDNLSDQAREVRAMILSGRSDTLIFADITGLLTNQLKIEEDTISLLDRAIMKCCGSACLSLGGNDWLLKREFFRRLIILHPTEVSFKFHFANCACMSGLPVQDFYPMLEEGMLLDKSNTYYPSNELFDEIRDSEFSFQFDLLLLDKYYQPCSILCFEDYLNGFREKYKTNEQIELLDKQKWRGQQ